MSSESLKISNLNRTLEKQNRIIDKHPAKELIDDIEFTFQQYDYDYVIILFADRGKGVTLPREDIGNISCTTTNPYVINVKSTDNILYLIPVNKIDYIKFGEFR